MSTCEKCWADSQFGGDYTKLLEERKDHPCTPEEQAGPDATECPECHHLTLHQHTGEPMCGCVIDPTPWCNGCGAMKQKDCHCSPIAENN